MKVSKKYVLSRSEKTSKKRSITPVTFLNLDDDQIKLYQPKKKGIVDNLDKSSLASVVSTSSTIVSHPTQKNTRGFDKLNKNLENALMLKSVERRPEFLKPYSRVLSSSPSATRMRKWRWNAAVRNNDLIQLLSKEGPQYVPSKATEAFTAEAKVPADTVPAPLTYRQKRSLEKVERMMQRVDPNKRRVKVVDRLNVAPSHKTYAPAMTWEPESVPAHTRRRLSTSKEELYTGADNQLSPETTIQRKIVSRPKKRDEYGISLSRSRERDLQEQQTDDTSALHAMVVAPDDNRIPSKKRERTRVVSTVPEAEVPADTVPAPLTYRQKRSLEKVERMMQRVDPNKRRVKVVDRLNVAPSHKTYAPAMTWEPKAGDTDFHADMDLDTNASEHHTSFSVGRKRPHVDVLLPTQDIAVKKRQNLTPSGAVAADTLSTNRHKFVDKTKKNKPQITPPDTFSQVLSTQDSKQNTKRRVKSRSSASSVEKSESEAHSHQELAVEAEPEPIIELVDAKKLPKSGSLITTKSAIGAAQRTAFERTGDAQAVSSQSSVNTEELEREARRAMIRELLKRGYDNMPVCPP